jgi:hypothetical protein
MEHVSLGWECDLRISISAPLQAMGTRIVGSDSWDGMAPEQTEAWRVDRQRIRIGEKEKEGCGHMVTAGKSYR